MRNFIALCAVATLAVCGTTTVHAQWVNFTNDTTTMMPTGGGQNDPAVSTADPEEKDYAWGDVNNDGWTDLVVARKIPFTFAGGKRNVLFMNENGVLRDRTSQYAAAAINVPGSEGVSQGFLDLTNDRDILLVDINNDGWLDIVTATTISDGLPRYIGHPRIYVNLGEVGGVWQGFVYDYNRIPQLFSKPSTSFPSGKAVNPRFCSVGSGDVNNDGYIDLFFGDYDTGEIGPGEDPNDDVDNKLLINMGAANPGVFVDESTLRMGASYNYGGSVGMKNLLYTTFGAASLIADMDLDGYKDVIKQTSLVAPQHVATIRNSAGNGMFGTTDYKIQYALSPYFVSAGDLNGDGRLDMVMTDDNADRYLLNNGNDQNGNPNFTQFTFSFQSGGDDGFGSNSLITDLNNDGWNDVLIADVDVDGFGCGRRLHIYRNLGNAPNVTLREDSPSIIATGSLTGTHDVAVFDINNDGWKDLVIGRCSTTQVWRNVPPASLAFSYPSGKPTSLTPNQPTTFQVQLTGVNGSPLANSGKIYISTNGSPFVQTSMTPLGGNLYEATIPGTVCPAGLRYYVSGQVSTGASFTDPATPIGASVPNTHYLAYAAGSTSTSINEDFEGAAAGWSVANDGSLTGGAWELTAPNGTWNEGVRAAPNANHTVGGSKCFVTGNAVAGSGPNVNDVDGGPTHLISPVIDLSGGNAVISYAYWFYTSTPGDVLTVAVSNDNGSNWTTVVTHAGPTLATPNTDPPQANAWKTSSFIVGNYVSPSSQVRVRFTANDVAPASIVEAAVDDVVATRIICSLPCPSDINDDLVTNVTDLLAVINSWGPCPGCPADTNGDNVVNVTDLLAVINGWGPCP